MTLALAKSEGAGAVASRSQATTSARESTVAILVHESVYPRSADASDSKSRGGEGLLPPSHLAPLPRQSRARLNSQSVGPMSLLDQPLRLAIIRN
jgi:hypothetical protein